MRFHVGNTTAGKPSWWLYGDNHKKVAWAGETFASIANARRAAEAFKTAAAMCRYETYLDDGGSPRWRAWHSSDKVAASGESFSSVSAAEAAAENVRLNAGSADLP